jgi:hypothetical protein
MVLSCAKNGKPKIPKRSPELLTKREERSRMTKKEVDELEQATA